MYCFGPFCLDPEERCLYRDGKPVVLRPKTLDLLLALLTNPGHLQTREALVRTVWPRTVVVEHGLTVTMGELRKALGDEEKSPRYIQTVPRSGYRFIAPVTVEKPVTAAPGIHRRRLGFALGAAGVVAICVVAGLFAGRLIRRVPTARRETTASIAVLPFENLSADPSNVYFVAGIQDEILTRLASIRSLKVISRTSTARYASRPEDLPAIARQLGVATVLEGSVQKTGDEVHVNVQLIDARTQVHIWAQSYDRTLGNVFGVENEVAETIASALQVRLLPQESARFSRVATGDPQAYDLFLRGNYYANRALVHGNTTTPQAAVRRAAVLYRQALAHDPQFALAWARLSLLESRAWWYGLDTTDARIAAADQAAKKALALDPDLPQAHMAMGYVAYYGHDDYPTALAQFEQAERGLPNDPDVMAALASIHRRQGGWLLALAEFRQAATLDPRNPRRYYETGVTLTELRRYAEAEQQFNQALAIEPQDLMVRAYRIRMWLLAGETARARRDLAAVPPNADPRGSFAALRFEFAWLARKPDQALAALTTAPAWVLSAFAEYELPTSLLRARAWGLKGDKEHARQAYDEARATLRGALQQQPDAAVLWGAFGMTEAGLGDRQAAIGAGGRAVQLVPVSTDAFYGSAHLAVLAAIYAQTGATGPAVQLLGELLAMPAGGTISVPLLRRDPTWDPLRHDPQFRALLKKYQGRAPVPLSAARRPAPSQADKSPPATSLRGVLVPT